MAKPLAISVEMAISWKQRSNNQTARLGGLGLLLQPVFRRKWPRRRTTGAAIDALLSPQWQHTNEANDKDHAVIMILDTTDIEGSRKMAVVTRPVESANRINLK